MIIENSDALKSWLTSCLARLCDADPAALAKYVMALVKKDKPENQLKEFCLDQLDVFLLKETKPFVEILFETLKSKAYLQQNANETVVNASSTSANSNITVPVNVTSHISNSTYCVSSPQQIHTPTKLAVMPTVSQTYSPVPVICKNEKDSKFEDFVGFQKTEQQVSKSRSRSRSRSRSPVSSRFRSRSRERDNLMRRRSDDERRHKNLRQNNRRHYRFQHDHERERQNRDKDRRINCLDRQRSRSRSGSYERRSRSSSKSSDYSRSRTRSRERSKDCSSRSDSKNSRKQIDSSGLTCEHGDTDYRLNSIPRTSDINKINKISRRTRCQDYNERGYCMRGDECPFDHGIDVLVVDDYSALNNLHTPQTAQVSHKPSSVISNTSVLPKPPGVESPIPPLPPPSSPPPPPPPPPTLPPLPPPPPPGSYAPEPYNPETPALYRPKGDHLLFYSQSCPPPLHPPGQPCPPGQPPLIPPLLGVPMFNPSEPPPSYHLLPKVERPRELIGVPTLATETINSNSSENGLISEPDQMLSLQRGETNTTHVTNTMSSVGTSQMENTFVKRKFDYNRLGPRRNPKKNLDNKILELRKVPKHLNTANNLINHFSQFGSITNVLTNIDNDPEAALVYFANHSEALKAYRHQEAVLHNRFIKLFWHNKDNSNNSQVIDNSIVSTSNSSFCDTENSYDIRKKRKDNNGTDVTSTTPITVGETKSTNAELISDKALPKRSGPISKPVFNPAALKKTNKPTVNVAKVKEELKTNALKKKIDLHKKKQAILQSYFENQKMLLEKYAACKTESEKELVKKTIEEIRKNILELQADLKHDTDEIKKLTKLISFNDVEKTDAQKELLDAELELYNKQHRGDDVSDLLSRVVELKQQTMNIVAGMGRGIVRSSRPPRRAMLNKFRPPRARPSSHHITRSLSIDHRPKKLLLSNASNIDKSSLMNHFLQFGDIENIDDGDNGGVVITFKTRKDAEMAMGLGSKFGDMVLLISWYHDQPEQPKQVSLSNFPGSLTCPFEDEEEEEEEEEEDSEARSWRR